SSWTRSRAGSGSRTRSRAGPASAWSCRSGIPDAALSRHGSRTPRGSRASIVPEPRGGSMKKRSPVPFLVLPLATAACGGEDSPPQTDVPGRDETARTDVLEAGAQLLQDFTPVAQIGVYLVGFHPSRDDPSVQME